MRIDAPFDTPYHTKAEAYARYRWDYAAEAIRVICDRTEISAQSTVADIGSGTGILARHFVERARTMYCVEPDSEMRRQAERLLNPFSSFRSIAGTAEATGLAGDSVDLITVGQAIHWFQPEAARTEFRRIRKKGGWLAILLNRSTDPAFGQAFEELFTQQNGCIPSTPPANRKPIDFYYQGDFLRYHFDNQIAETWEQFFGGCYSDSHAPNPDHPCYPQFVSTAERIFERLSPTGLLTLTYTTELYLGRQILEMSINIQKREHPDQNHGRS